MNSILLNCLRCTTVLTLGLVGPAAIAFDQGHVVAGPAAHSEGLVERRMLAPGDAYYDRMLQQHPSPRLADQLLVEVVYPSGLDWSIEATRAVRSSMDHLLAGQGDALSTAKSYDLPNPEPPDTTPPIGTRHSITVSCAQVRTSASSSYSADITYTWEYRYTRDTNGDNKPDADPEWVLVGVTVTPLFTEGQPHLC